MRHRYNGVFRVADRAIATLAGCGKRAHNPNGVATNGGKESPGAGRQIIRSSDAASTNRSSVSGKRKPFFRTLLDRADVVPDVLLAFHRRDVFMRSSKQADIWVYVEPRP